MCYLSSLPEQVLSYIKSLESRVMVLESEKQQLSEELIKMDRIHPDGEVTEFHESNQDTQIHAKDKTLSSRPPHPPPYSLSHHLRAVGLGLTGRTPLGPGKLSVPVF